MSGTQAYTHLVVGDAGAGRVGDGDVAGLPRPHQPGHAERRVGTERLGIEEQVVDAAVDHVDRARARRSCACRRGRRRRRRGRRPPQASAPIRWARNECSKYAELKMPGVSTATFGSRRPVGRERHEQLVQLVGVARRRARCSGGANSSGNAALGDGAVLEHVADARRDAQVVLEHVHRAVGVADEIGPADVRPHAEASGARPRHSGRKFAESSSRSPGNTPSATMRWSL